MSLAHRWLLEVDPRRPALTTPTLSRTYGAQREAVGRAITWLRAHDVGPGDVVAVQMPRCPEILDLFLATQAIGAILVPLNDRSPPAELVHPLTDSGARLAILLDAAAEPEPAPAARVVRASSVPAELASADAAPLGAARDPEAVGVICYTSGTTGRPKGARIRQANVAATVDALHRAWRWRSADVLLHVLPLYHIHGLFVAAGGALRAGAHAVWTDGFDPEFALDAMAAHAVTVFMGVPTHYTRLLEVPEGRTVPPSLRLFTSGSAPLAARTHRAFSARFGHEIVERYGMTEVGIVTSNPLDGPRKPGSIGVALPGVERRVVVDDGARDAEVGEVGELWIRGPSVFEGYHRRPEATEAALRGGWMRTGDHGHLDADGYVHLAGRRSDLVLVGGFNVYPEEVERALADHPGVAEIAVYGVADPDLGERPEAAVVPRGRLDTDELSRWARARLAAYKVPRRFHLVDRLPRNAMGKVLKRELKARGTDPGGDPEPGI